MKLEKLNALYGTIATKENDEEVMDLNVQKIMELVKSTGVVLFRGYDVNQDQFQAFTDLFSKKMVKHAFVGVRKTLSKDGTVAEVLSGNGEIELHGEMYYKPEPRPELLWLCCIEPSAELGATTICDGQMFFDSLKPETQKLFLTKKIMYTHVSLPVAWKAFSGETEIDAAVKALANSVGVKDVEKTPEGLVKWKFVTNAIIKGANSKYIFINSIRNILQGIKSASADSSGHFLSVTFEDGTKIPSDVLAELYEVGNKNIYPVQWQPGEMIVVDNRRMMHGRQKFEGKRFIITRFSMAS